MTATNDVTGDRLVSTTSDAYRDNYDSIFGKDKVKDKPKNTDLDKFKDLFSKSNIPFEEYSQEGLLSILIAKGNDKVHGEPLTNYVEYVFDTEGNFEYIYIC